MHHTSHCSFFYFLVPQPLPFLFSHEASEEWWVLEVFVVVCSADLPLGVLFSFAFIVVNFKMLIGA